jgi:hypothetical protein
VVNLSFSAAVSPGFDVGGGGKFPGTPGFPGMNVDGGAGGGPGGGPGGLLVGGGRGTVLEPGPGPLEPGHQS